VKIGTKKRRKIKRKKAQKRRGTHRDKLPKETSCIY
jgi:hypothetical protein